MVVPFNRPYLVGTEESYVLEALRSGRHCGNYAFTQKCTNLLQEAYKIKKVFLVPSGTAALEMTSVLAKIQPGDEVILPSYTFSSTANAYCLRGAKPVFADIDPKTFVLNPKSVQEKLSKKTRAVIPINYGGVSPDLNQIVEMANSVGALVIEDAAQGIGAKYRGQWVGSVTPLSIYSFHETKNISCGEGGAVLVNDPNLFELGEFAQEKGTDRSLVIAGVKSKYSWVSLGSSYLLSDMLSAFLLAQLEARSQIYLARKTIHDAYTKMCLKYLGQRPFQIQQIPSYCETNYHGFYLLFDQAQVRDQFLIQMKEKGVNSYIGYLPLHSSQMGRSFGFKAEDCPVSESVSARIARLPLYNSMSPSELEFVLERVESFLRNL